MRSTTLPSRVQGRLPGVRVPPGLNRGSYTWVQGRKGFYKGGSRFRGFSLKWVTGF